MRALIILLMISYSSIVKAQVAINTDNSAPDPSAMLDVKSTNRGLLVPRMTLAQRNAIPSPATGLIIFQTDGGSGLYYNAGVASGMPAWTLVGGSGGQWLINGNNLYYNAGNVGIGTSTPTRAKLEVHGAEGYTSAIFGGESTGISLTRNNPGIGFNQYYSTTNKNIANGYSASLWFDATSGYLALDMHGFGTTNSNTPGSIRSFNIGNDGNIGIKTTPVNASFYTVKGTNFAGSAILGGTSYSSLFSYSTTEDTYIRGGLSSSTVYINDIPNGNIQMGNGSSKVGINTLPWSPQTALEIGGGISLRAALYVLTFGNNTIVVGDRSYIHVTNGEWPSILQMYITDGISPGQILLIESAASNGFSGIDIGDSVNVNIEGNGWRMQGEETLVLLWNGIKWLELSRSNNYN